MINVLHFTFWWMPKLQTMIRGSFHCSLRLYRQCSRVGTFEVVCVWCVLDSWYEQAQPESPVNHSLENVEILTSLYIPSGRICRKTRSAFKIRDSGHDQAGVSHCKEGCPCTLAVQGGEGPRQSWVIRCNSLPHVDPSSNTLSIWPLLDSLRAGPPGKPVSPSFSLGPFFDLTGPLPTTGLESAGVQPYALSV